MKVKRKIPFHNSLIISNPKNSLIPHVHLHNVR